MPTIRLRGGYELTVDRFEYVSLGGAVLARVEGDLPEPGYPLPRLALVVDRAGARDRIRALSAPDPGTPPERWRAAFPLSPEIVEDPDIEYSLYAAGRIVALDAPRSRSLDARQERLPSRREQLLAQRERRERLLAGDDEHPRRRPRREEPESAEPVEPEAPEPEGEVVEAELVEAELVETEIVTDAVEVDDALKNRVAELERELATSRTDAAKQRTRADALASQIKALDRSVAKARGEAAAAESAAREARDTVESAVAEAAALARSEAEAAAESAAGAARETYGRLQECLRRMVASADRVAAVEAEREAVQERLRGALFDIGGTDPEALVAHEQALGELVEREREALDEAWDAARELVAVMPEDLAVTEAAGR
jgi:hypothetical protein